MLEFLRDVRYLEVFMNIVFISSASTTSAGGDARVARELAEKLSEDNKVLLILSGDETCHRSINDNFYHFEISGKKKGDVTLPTIKPVELSAFSKILRNFEPDIIHFHDQGPASLIGLIWSLKNKVPTVFTSHTLPSEVISFGLAELFPKTQFLFDNKFFDTYLRLFLKRSSAIVAINNAVVEDLSKYDISTPIYKIPNGRSLETYGKAAFASIKDLPLRMLFVGYLNKRKNQNYLLDVMCHLPRDKYVLDLVGVPLNGDYEEHLTLRVSNEDLPVSFLGKVPHGRIPEILEKTHFFVSASLMEVQSLVILEALGSGTPVISLNNETTSEFIDESVGYNFPSNVSPATFAEKVKELSSISPEKYEEMCSASRKRVSHLDWSNIADQTLSMYKEVIESKIVSRQGLNGIRKLFKGVDIALFE